MEQQLSAVKLTTSQSAFDSATACALRVLEVYESQSQLENLVTWKSVNHGEKINEEDPHPSCILTSRYQKVRVDLRIKLQIEAEAKTMKNGNSK